MKKHIFLTLLFSITCFVGIFGQSAKKSLNYQAVILDPKPIDIPGASLVGQPLSKGKVCLKFSLVNAQGSVDYEETQQTTTDEYGLVSLSIGTGTYSSGTYKSFESIVWDANVKSMKVAVSYDGCNTFKQVSTQALNYTPYALYAEAVDYKNVREAPTKLSQFSNDVGYILPKDLDPLKVDIKKNTDDIKKNTEDIKANTAELKTNSLQIASANKAIIDNKKASDDAFLIVNQSISTLGSKVALNSDAIWVTEGKVADLQYQTSEIRKKINSSDSTINRKANIDSPVFTGTPELPSGTKAITQNSTDNSTKIATTAFVQQVAIANLLLVKPFIDPKAPINSPVFTGTPELPSGTMAVTQDKTDNSTKIATTAFVQQASADGLAFITPFVDAKANIDSPLFTGTPELPSATMAVTQDKTDNSTKIATTAFVQQASADAKAYIDANFEVADEFKATASQTVFTLSKTPSTRTKVKMYINGIRVSNTCYSWDGVTLTYNPINNGAYDLTTDDRIQFDYFSNDSDPLP